VHTDNEIANGILKPFLRWWRDRNPALLYVWKAEVQDNGNIHFHVTSNSFIHHEVLRRHWNKKCELLKYTSRSRSTNPNSTDVHAVKNVRNLASYLCAYITKKDLYTKPLKRYHKRYGKALLADTSEVFHLPKNYLLGLKREVKCKIWDASKLLLEGPCRVYMCGPEHNSELAQIKYTGGEVTSLERCTIYTPTPASPSFGGLLKNEYEMHIASIRQRCKEVVAILN
jgi:hypothetical protein